MTDTTRMQGECLCGAVRITANEASHSVCACHCETCRRWAGAPFMEVGCGQAVTFDGEEHVAVYASSDWAERGFCRQCGTHLFYRLKSTGEHMVPVGLLGDSDALKFEKQVFVDEKPAYYRFENDTQNLTGPELFALFSQPDSE